MKKYFAYFILTAAMTVTLAGCTVDPPVSTPVYTDNMPSLTAVPWTTSVPNDTYSQYMETYTETETLRIQERRTYLWILPRPLGEVPKSRALLRLRGIQ